MADKPKHGPRGGRYADDPRVTRDEGRAGYRLPSSDGDDWHIRRSGYGGWSATSEYGQVAMDPTDRHCQRLQLFGSADDAIGHIIGEPEGTGE